MAQLHHHKNPSEPFLQDYGSSDEKQCHDHEQEHNSSIGEKCVLHSTFYSLFLGMAFGVCTRTLVLKL
jgi:hypothetical protein